MVKAKLPVEIRTLGTGLPHALTVAGFGGTAEDLALWSKGAGHGAYFYWCVPACIAISLVVSLTIKETLNASPPTMRHL